MPQIRPSQPSAARTAIGTTWLKDTAEILAKPILHDDGPTVKEVLDYYRSAGELPTAPFGDRYQHRSAASFEHKRGKFESLRQADNGSNDQHHSKGHLRLGRRNEPESRIHTEVVYEGDSKNGHYRMVQDLRQGKVFIQTRFDGNTHKQLSITVKDTGTKIYENTQTRSGLFGKTRGITRQINESQLATMIGDWEAIIAK